MEKLEVWENAEICNIRRILTTTTHMDLDKNFRKYLKKLYDTFLGLPQPDSRPFNGVNLRKLIADCYLAEHLQKNGFQLTSKKKKLLEVYEAVSCGQRKYLLLRNTNRRVIISCDYAYPIIVKMHEVSNHGNLDTIKKLMNEQFPDIRVYEEDICINLVLQLCRICELTKAVQKSGAKMYNLRCFVYIAEMPIDVEITFKYLLVLVDEYTHFVHLRPCSSIDETEVAITLLKVFVDFGTPLEIETPEYLFFEKVVKVLKTLSPACSVTLTPRCLNSKDWAAPLINNIKKRTKDTKRANWVLACHMLQWTMNTRMDDDIKDTPYNAVFGKKREPSIEPNEKETKKVVLKRHLIKNTVTVDSLIKNNNDNKDKMNQVTSFESLFNLPTFDDIKHTIGDESNSTKKTVKDDGGIKNNNDVPKNPTNQVTSFEPLINLPKLDDCTHANRDELNSTKKTVKDEKGLKNNNDITIDLTNQVTSFESLFNLPKFDDCTHTNSDELNHETPSNIEASNHEIIDSTVNIKMDKLLQHFLKGDPKREVGNIKKTEEAYRHSRKKEKLTKENIICLVCRSELSVPRYCDNCKKPVHSKCLERTYSTNNVGEISSLCLPCIEIEKKYDRLKKKAAEFEEEIRKIRHKMKNK